MQPTPRTSTLLQLSYTSLKRWLTAWQMTAPPDQAGTARVASLERQVWFYRALTVTLAGLLLLGVNLAARPVSSISPLLQTQRLEIVDAAGNRLFAAGVGAEGGLVQTWNRTGTLGFAAYATRTGGRLEVLHPTGTPVFSAGSRQNEPDPVGLWEQMQHAVERQERELHEQRRLLEELSRQLRSQPARPSSGLDQRSYELDQLRSTVDQQRHSIDMLERNLQHLTSQIRRLERP